MSEPAVETESLALQVDGLLELATVALRHCREQSEGTAGLMAQLREEAQGLRGMAGETEQDMTEMQQHIGELMDAARAYEARARQVRKLSRTL